MLASMAAPGTDIALSEDRILGARAFANKIWNAARFLFVNLEKVEAQRLHARRTWPRRKFARKRRTPFPAKARSRIAGSSRVLSAVAAQVNDALENFRFHEACQTIYHFFWGDFCDWYIEWVKPQLAVERSRRSRSPAWRNIFAALDAALRLLHPVMPFLTEELWHRLPQPAGARSIALDRFPEARPGWANTAADDAMAILQEIVVAARNIRAEMKLDPKRKVAAISGPAARCVATWSRRHGADPAPGIALGAAYFRTTI